MDRHDDGARGRPSWPRRLATVLGVTLALGAAALGGFQWWLRVPPIPSTPDQAIARFTEVMNGAAEESDRALSALAGAVAERPEHARARLWFALASLHRFLDHREFRDAIRASRAFDAAVELAPNDASAAGWRAFWRYQAQKARGGDLEARRAELLAASKADPRFTPFLAAVSLAELSLASGYPQRVLADLERIEDCGDGTDWTCRTGQLFPFGTEGFHATLGDLRVRVGDLEGGRAQYARALATRTAHRWPHRDAFEAWAAGASARAALWANDDPSDDPEVFFGHGPRACSMCHDSASSSPQR